jgi:hypothetical protein
LGVQNDPERLNELMQTKSPDRHRWGTLSSYDPNWVLRGRVAAEFIPDNARVLEIGTGTGAFRELIADRCHYTGADLEPIDGATLAFDLDNDEVPRRPWDTIVVLGVLEYLYYPLEALKKIANSTSEFVTSYCCCSAVGPESIAERSTLGWTNSMTERGIIDEMDAHGFRLVAQQSIESTPYYEQIVFKFIKV